MWYLLLLGLLPQDDAARELELRDHDALRMEIARIADTHAVASTVSLGISREGRVIQGLVLDGAELAAKPAILLVANLEGPDVFDSAVALDHARALAEGYGSDEAVTKLLDTTRVYVIPRANPDAAEARFLTPREERTTGGRGIDNDRDGRSGEDGPADVDGDGLVSWMRVPDPEGKWMEDPTDPRASVEAKIVAGERGEFRLEVEGFDRDGDEEVAEDPERDTIVNANFASGWEEHGEHAGLFPSDEPEARALMEFVLGHDDIALVLCYGAPDNLNEKPKSVADDAPSKMRVPPEGVLQSDADVLAELAERYEETTENSASREADDAGTFQRWCYDHRGLLTLSTVLWEMPEEWKEEDPPPEEEGEADADEDETEEAVEEEEEEEPENDLEPSLDAKRLTWIDGSEESWRFVDWRPFDHPDLGSVEIGGFAPFALREPPTDEMALLADVHLAFLQELGGLLARVTVAECTAEELGGGLWRVTVTVANNALLPFQTRAARRSRTVRPARMVLDAGDGAVVAGPAQVLIEDLHGEREETTWLVRTGDPDAITVTVETTHAGIASASAEVKR